MLDAHRSADLIKLTVHVSLDGANILELRSGQFPGLLADLGFQPLDVKFDLSSLPFGVKLTSLAYTPTAVQVQAEGKNVNLSQAALSGSSAG